MYKSWFRQNVGVFTFLLAAFIGIGRFTIPGRELIGGWPGIYEAVAHIFLGILFCIGCYEQGKQRWFAWGSFLVVTFLVEVPMFARFKGWL
jgi:hypothetical protein